MAQSKPELDQVLIVGDPGRGARRRENLRALAGQVVFAGDKHSAWELLRERGFDLVIVTEALPDAEAMSFLEEVRREDTEVPVVICAGRPSVRLAVQFIRAGAYDYIPAPLEAERLHRLVEGMRLERSRKCEGVEGFFSPQCPPDVAIAGKSPAIVEALEQLRLVAESRCNPILILGETGTGKELAARAVHSWRCGDPEKFVAVNCAALTANLLESELFGHVKGAFTGADREKTGLFEVASDGTLLLDEISEMPRDLQAKLLRVLQECRFRKVGGTKDIECKATIIATSNRNLKKEAGENRFRRDLYYRLAIFPITLLPLRHERRRGDIPLLAEYFLHESALAGDGRKLTFSKPAREELLDHEWPGNVRELRNVIQRAEIVEESQEVRRESLIIERTEDSAGPGGRSSKSHNDFSLETAEREFILRALRETGWQRTRAAALLGITRATLHAKLKRYDIQPPETRNTGKGVPPTEDASTREVPTGSGVCENPTRDE